MKMIFPYDLLDPKNDQIQDYITYFSKIYQLIYSIDSVSVEESPQLDFVYLEIKDGKKYYNYHWYEFFYMEMSSIVDLLWSYTEGGVGLNEDLNSEFFMSDLHASMESTSENLTNWLSDADPVEDFVSYGEDIICIAKLIAIESKLIEASKALWILFPDKIADVRASITKKYKDLFPDQFIAEAEIIEEDERAESNPAFVNDEVGKQLILASVSERLDIRALSPEMSTPFHNDDDDDDDEYNYGLGIGFKKNYDPMALPSKHNASRNEIKTYLDENETEEEEEDTSPQLELVSRKNRTEDSFGIYKTEYFD